MSCQTLHRYKPLGVIKIGDTTPSVMTIQLILYIMSSELIKHIRCLIVATSHWRQRGCCKSFIAVKKDETKKKIFVFLFCDKPPRISQT